MHTLHEHLTFDVSSLFNSQRHIDEVQSGLDASEAHSSEIYTFMLKHKHFDLAPGEVLWVEKVPNGYDTQVKKNKEINTDAAPCMWIYKQGWKPFCYCKKDLAPATTTSSKGGLQSWTALAQYWWI